MSRTDRDSLGGRVAHAVEGLTPGYFALVMATISAYLTEGPAKAILPLALLVLVGVSYFTRPANRRVIGNTLWAART